MNSFDIEPFSLRKYLASINSRRRILGENGVSNCIGTALYLVGEQPTDSLVYNSECSEGVNIEDHSTFITSLPEVTIPQTGCLVAWVNGEEGSFRPSPFIPMPGEVYHLGVVVNRNPLKIAHRENTGGTFSRSEFIYNAKRRCTDTTFPSDVRYFIPNQMQKVLGHLK